MILWERFDSNEWFMLAVLFLSYGAIWLLPKRVPVSWMILSLVWGVASSTVFDFTIGGGLMDFYVINDTNHYEFVDLFTYAMFAPFGYFFIYGYELLRISRATLILYVIGWTIIGVSFQWLAALMGLTHYQNGYQMEYNVVVFLVIQSITGLFYGHMRANLPFKRPSKPSGRSPARARWSPKKPSLAKFRRARKSPL